MAATSRRPAQLEVIDLTDDTAPSATLATPFCRPPAAQVKQESNTPISGRSSSTIHLYDGSPTKRVKREHVHTSTAKRQAGRTHSRARVPTTSSESLPGAGRLKSDLAAARSFSSLAAQLTEGISGSASGKDVLSEAEERSEYADALYMKCLQYLYSDEGRETFSKYDQYNLADPSKSLKFNDFVATLSPTMIEKLLERPGVENSVRSGTDFVSQIRVLHQNYTAFGSAQMTQTLTKLLEDAYDADKRYLEEKEARCEADISRQLLAMSDEHYRNREKWERYLECQNDFGLAELFEAYMKSEHMFVQCIIDFVDGIMDRPMEAFKGFFGPFRHQKAVSWVKHVKKTSGSRSRDASRATADTSAIQSLFGGNVTQQALRPPHFQFPMPLSRSDPAVTQHHSRTSLLQNSTKQYDTAAPFSPSYANSYVTGTSSRAYGDLAWPPTGSGLPSLSSMDFDPSDPMSMPSAMPSAAAALAAEEDFQTFLDELNEDEIDENEGTNTAQEVADAAEAIGAERLLDNKYSFPGLRCTLHPHQVIGIAWMCKREQQKDDNGKRSKVRGGILADAMGLGKTVQALGVMLRNKPASSVPEQSRPKTTLIVCPVALIYQWEREIVQKARRQFTNIRIHHGQNKLQTKEEFNEADVVITSYGTLAREYPIKKLKRSATAEERIEAAERLDRDKGLLFRVKFFRFILDEAHTIKNPAANVSIACCEIDAQRQWCLTGTPFQNKVEDIFPLFSVLNVPYFSTRANFNKSIDNSRHGAEKLRGVLAPFLKRRNKDDKIAGLKVLVLPDKHVNLKILSLEDAEKELYKQVETQMVNTINKFLKDGVAVKKFNHIFIMVLRLRQLCIHPYLILEHLATKNEFDQEDFIRNANGMQSFTNLFQDGLLDDTALIICSICMDQAADPVISRTCRHCFCSGCAKDQLEDPDARCPACSSIVGTLVKYDARLHQSAASDMPSHAASANLPAIEEKPKNEVFDGSTDTRGSTPMTMASEFAGSDEGTTTNAPRLLKYESLSSSTVDDEEVAAAVKQQIASPGPASSAASGYDKSVPIDINSDDEDLPVLDIRLIGSRAGKENKPSTNSVKAEPIVKAELVVKAEPIVKAEQSSSGVVKSESGTRVLSPTDESKLNVVPSTPAHASTATQAASSARKPRIPLGFHSNEIGNTKPNQNDTEWQALLKMDYIPSTKLTAVEDQLREWMMQDDSKIIVFSQFVKALDLVEKVCEMNDFNVLRYHGSMNMRERECTITQFEDADGPRILLMSLKAGGVGLNLVCASKVLMLDFWWNAAVEHQAVDRCHRMGQVKEVVVIRTYFPGTIEEKILDLQESKLKTAGTVLGEREGGGRMAKLGLRELLGLFGRVETDSYGVQQIVAHSSNT